MARITPDSRKAAAAKEAARRERLGLPMPVTGPVREIMQANRRAEARAEQMRNLNVEVPTSMHRELKIASAKTGIPVRKIVMPAIQAYLKKIV